MPRPISDLSGQKFGRLTVSRFSHINKNGAAVWHCRCNCGNTTKTRGYSLKSGDTTSCGCLRIEALSGQKFGRLTVKDFSHRNKRGKTVWNAICQCGTNKKILADSLKSGKTRSCGCIRSTHGYSGHPLYKVWNGMVARCENPKSINYHNYGGRGISVCKAWRGSVGAFIQDMGARPVGTSLDRIDNSGDYTLKNCRWATAEQQNRNSRNNHILTFNGVSFCVKTWAEKIGMPYQTLLHRLKAGWSVEKTLSQPVQRHTRMLTFAGLTLCVTSWAEKIGIPRNRLYARLNRGWDAAKTLTQPVQFRRSTK